MHIGHDQKSSLLAAPFVCTLLACSAEAPTAPAPATTPPTTQTTCLTEGDQPLLARDDSGACPRTLVVVGQQVELREHQQLEPNSDGPQLGTAPVACEHPQACDWQVAHSGAQPVVLATLPGIRSEHPRGLWLGLGHRGTLVFIPLWDNDHATLDGSDAGPAWWLEPTICGDTLILTPRPRLAVARGESPPPSLSQRAGSYRFSATAPFVPEHRGPAPEDADCASLPFSYP